MRSTQTRGSKTAMPSGPEQLRLRLTVLQNALIMIQLRHPSREELKDVTMALFERVLLGDYTATASAPARTRAR